VRCGEGGSHKALAMTENGENSEHSPKPKKDILAFVYVFFEEREGRGRRVGVNR